jgi:hypothetical protein
MTERHKHRCYRCGLPYEGLSIFGDVRLSVPGKVVPSQVEYNLCPACVTAANDLLESWCARGVPLPVPS